MALNRQSPVMYCMDSGAELTVSREKTAFTRWDRHEPVPLGQAGGALISSKGRGTVRGLRDVLYVPQLRTPGLISTSVISDTAPDLRVIYDRRGVHVVWAPDLVDDLRDDGHVLVSGPRVRGLYYIDPALLASALDSAKQRLVMPLATTKPVNRCILWHQRLCHMNFPDLRRLRDGSEAPAVKFSDVGFAV